MSRPNDCPKDRLRVLNDGEANPAGKFILYWMHTTRRVEWNYAMDRAVQLASEMQKPLIVFEAIRCNYPWASDRFHKFVLEGMADNASALKGTDVHYYPYVEPTLNAGKGLLGALAVDACVVVTDDTTIDFLARMVDAATAQIEVKLEAVDSNGALPVHVAPQAFSRAFDFRRFLQRELAPHLEQPPKPDSIRGTELRRLRGLPGAITRKWPVASATQLAASQRALEDLPIDHDVPATDLRGGTKSARQALARFVQDPSGLMAYGTNRNHPDEVATSGLSPFLHFGHISTHEVLATIAKQEGWSPDQITSVRTGKRAGWWGMTETSEGYLDQLITWRELGMNFATNRDDMKCYDALPGWALQTLADHAGDPRPMTYTFAEFDAADTQDPIWNAAQTELRESGRMHNYLRMLWGKKILHWSETPQEALETMIQLNDRYALDGRDPNSYSGIFWVLGRFDRAWGPERDVFGKVRYMSSKNTRRKLRLNGYLRKWGGKDECALFPSD